MPQEHKSIMKRLLVLMGHLRGKMNRRLERYALDTFAEMLFNADTSVLEPYDTEPERPETPPLGEEAQSPATGSPSIRRIKRDRDKMKDKIPPWKKKFYLLAIGVVQYLMQEADELAFEVCLLGMSW